jgi:hypothetical protein
MMTDQKQTHMNAETPRTQRRNAKTASSVFPPRSLRLGVQFFFVVALSILISRGAVAAERHEGHAPKEAIPGVSSLDVCAQGDTIHLLIAVKQESGPAQIRYLRSTDAGETWTSPVLLGEDQPATIAKRGMDAQIAAAGDSLVAVWPTAGTDKMGRGPMATAVSSDGGWTWRAGPNPSDSDLTIGHSFIDVVADASGAFHLVWLDSRDGDSKGLRYARSSDGGATWSKNQTLDADTCECCWNNLRVAPDGRLCVLYRDANPRDMAMVSSADAGRSWTSPVTVGAFDWSITACPHVGGAIAFSDARTAHAAVWTAKDTNAYGVFVLTSPDAGRTWGAPIRVGPAEASRPDLAAGPGGELTLVYGAYVEGEQGVFAITSTDSGLNWSNPRRLSSAGASASHPRLATTSAGVRAFWTERKSDGRSVWLSTMP